MTDRAKLIEGMAVKGYPREYCKSLDEQESLIEGYRAGAKAAFEIADRERDLAIAEAYSAGLAEANRWWAERWLLCGQCEWPDIDEQKTVDELDARAKEVLGDGK